MTREGKAVATILGVLAVVLIVVLVVAGFEMHRGGGYVPWPQHMMHGGPAATGRGVFREGDWDDQPHMMMPRHDRRMPMYEMPGDMGAYWPNCAPIGHGMHGMMGGGMTAAGAGLCSSPVFRNGKLYLVTADHLVRLDASTLEEEKVVELPLPERAATWYENMAQAFMKTFDADADGVISSAELPDPMMMEMMDSDRDGKLSSIELRSGMASPAKMMRRGCPVCLLVENGSVFVCRAGTLYRFDAGSLELQASSELPAGPSKTSGLPGMTGGMCGRMGPGMMHVMMSPAMMPPDAPMHGEAAKAGE